MKRIFEWMGGFALIAFSFYLTDRVSMLVANKTDLMKEIKAVSSVYEEKPIDAVINIKDNTIIPGKYGKKVNTEESYLNMQDFGSFNENYLIYDYNKPKTSLEDNKKYYITKGNSSLRKINLVLEPSSNIEKYLNDANIKYDLISNVETQLKQKNIENINGETTEENFKKLDSKIKNINICIKDYSNLEMCKKKKYYIIDPALQLKQHNIIEVKNNLEPGSIVLITKESKLEDLKILLNEIKYKDLIVVHTSELISEK